MKSIKHIIFAFFLLVVFSLSSMGQEPGEREKRMEKYRTIKIAFFTDELEFTTDEAEKFWPLYNKFQKDDRELDRTYHTMIDEFPEDPDDLSEEKAKFYLDSHIEMVKKEMEMEIKFHYDLEKILPAKKVVKFYITEEEFREHMLRKIREDHRNNDRERDEPIP
jgi:hypothetical protein